MTVRARIEPVQVRARIDSSFGGAVTCADGTVLITNTDDTLLYTKTVPSGGTDTQQIPDQTAKGTTDAGEISFAANTEGVIPDVDYTDSDGVEKTNPYGDALVCTPLSSLTDQQVNDGLTAETKNTLLGINVTRLGETPVQYSPNDTGARDPGRLPSFLTLDVLNDEGNFNRFLMKGVGLAYDAATGIYWTSTDQGSKFWTTHLVDSAALSIPLTAGGTVSNFRLPSRNEYMTILDQYAGKPLNHSVFNLDFSNAHLATGDTWLGNLNNLYSIFIYSSSRGYTTFASRNKTTNGVNALYCVHENELP